MDTDVIFYQDLTHLLQTSYQFTMRWQNIHVLRLEANSSLTRRMMQVATTMPQNHPDFEKEIIDKLCKKNGYYQLVAGSYKFMDIYNACLFRLLLKFNNTGPPDAVLYDLPLGELPRGWLSQHGAVCCLTCSVLLAWWFLQCVCSWYRCCAAVCDCDQYHK
ncbi:hypothetical protein [Microcoleus sp.]|uniref:hypothetical protein n=1 Tax=Microcoleus sp. TaxID=44472 RepID=UPI003593E7AC